MTDPLAGLCRPHSDRRLRIYPAHSFAHDDELAALLKLLEPDWLQGRDYVILAPRVHDPLHTGPDSGRLARELMNRMDAADVVWAMAGRYATESPWIGFENNYTTVIEKPVLTIARLGQERLSTVATADGTRAVARWRKDSIISMSLDVLPPSVRREFIAAQARRAERRHAHVVAAPSPTDWLAGGALIDALDLPPLSTADGGVFGAIRHARTLRTGGVFEALDFDPFAQPNALGGRIGAPASDALCGALRRMFDDDV
jgi:hypothetical protein